MRQTLLCIVHLCDFNSELIISVLKKAQHNSELSIYSNSKLDQHTYS